MPGIKILRWVAGAGFAMVSLIIHAEALQTDPAWQKGRLTNGFSWQVLSTPQRPADHLEIRLVVNTGSLSETAQQTGFSHLLARIALVQNSVLTPQQQRALWQADMQKSGALPLVLTSYGFTQYNLSLPVDRPDLLKDALAWLSATAEDMTLNDQTVTAALNASDPTATLPPDSQDALWHYRLKGSALAAQPSERPDPQQLADYYHQWYTPDAMTLYVVGNIDTRVVVEQINKVFSKLQGKRVTPAPIPLLPPLADEAVTLTDKKRVQPRLFLIWDTPWTPLKDSLTLEHYWLNDLAREALYRHVQTAAEPQDIKLTPVGFRCQILYLRAQCGLSLDASPQELDKRFKSMAQEMLRLKDQGITSAEFDSLIARKVTELNTLFAIYARTTTEVLVRQRLRSQQNAVVDIAPEQYQKLRQAFLAGLIRDALNHQIHLQLSKPLSMVLSQPEGEPEIPVGPLQARYQQLMGESADAGIAAGRPLPNPGTRSH